MMMIIYVLYDNAQSMMMIIYVLYDNALRYVQPIRESNFLASCRLSRCLSLNCKSSHLALRRLGSSYCGRSTAFHVRAIARRNHGRSTVVTSQFPIENWHEVVGSPTLADAIIERILTRAHRIELQGESLRRLSRSREKEAES